MHSAREILHSVVGYKVYYNGSVLPCIILGGTSAVWILPAVTRPARNAAGYQSRQINYHIAGLYGTNLRHQLGHRAEHLKSVQN